MKRRETKRQVQKPVSKKEDSYQEEDSFSPLNSTGKWFFNRKTKEITLNKQFIGRIGSKRMISSAGPLL